MMEGKCPMMNILKAGFLAGLMAPMAMAQENNLSKQNDRVNSALEELELVTAALDEGLKEGSLSAIQQYDKDAERIIFQQEPDRYLSALKDRYYGYQLFFLVDKSKSKGPSKIRAGSGVEPQTLYIYKRVDDSLQLIKVLPVSTGKEVRPNKFDTREGFTRVQSAQAKYTSRKYGEAMPFSLWFESEYGTAIHQTRPDWCNNKIGSRASAGCIRLCPGSAEEVFNLVKPFVAPAREGFRNLQGLGSNAIVLFEKVSGLPYKMDSGMGTLQAKTINGPEDDDMDPKDRLAYNDIERKTAFQDPPTVIEGLPVFVRIIDASNNPEKRQELNDIIADPTKGFQKYFVPFDIEAVKSKLIPSI